MEYVGHKSLYEHVKAQAKRRLTESGNVHLTRKQSHLEANC